MEDTGVSTPLAAAAISRPLASAVEKKSVLLKRTVTRATSDSDEEEDEEEKKEDGDAKKKVRMQTKFP